MKDIQKMLDERIASEIEDLDNLASGTDEKTAAVEDLAKLHKMRMEEMKAQNEVDSKRAEEAKLEESRRSRWFNAGLTGIGIVLPLICYGHWFKSGLMFEQTGAVSSSFFRNLVNGMKPIPKK